MLNKEIFDWYLVLKDNFCNGVYCWFCADFNIQLICCEKSLSIKIFRLVNNIRKLKKLRKNSRLVLLLGETFTPPVANNNSLNISNIPEKITLISEIKMLKKEKKNLKTKIESMMDLKLDYFTHLKDFEDMSNNLHMFISKHSLIVSELNRIKKLYCEKVENLSIIENKLEITKSHKKLFSVRNLNKKVKYRDAQLEIKKNEINSLKKETKCKISQFKKETIFITSILESSDINISEFKKTTKVAKKSK